MSEREIREAIRKVCSQLDGSLRMPQASTSSMRRVVMPLVLGAGLVGAACGSDGDETGQGGSSTDTGVQTGTQAGTPTGTTTGTGVGDPQPTYGVFGGWGPEGGAGGRGGGGAAGGGGGS